MIRMKRKRNNSLFLWGVLIILFFITACSYKSSIKQGASSEIFIRPYLQNVTPQGITIIWWTDKGECPGDSILYYWKKGEADKKSVSVPGVYEDTVGKCRHEITLKGLQGLYGYYAQSGEVRSERYEFKTAPAPGDNRGLSFVIMGDGRTDNETVIMHQREVYDKAYAYKPDLAFNLGDAVYRGDEADWESYWRKVVTNTAVPGISFAGNIPNCLVVGNHEIASLEGFNHGNLKTTMKRWQSYVSNPPNNDSDSNWEERYYSFNYGPATFIILDTNNSDNSHYDNSQPLPNGSTPDWAPGSTQYNWLVGELRKARKEAAFTFVMMHPSPYSSGVHGEPGEDQTGYYIRILDPLFRHFEVDGVFSSHDHLVERSLTGPPGFESDFDQGDPKNLNYFVMGNSGCNARAPQPGWESWMSVHNNGIPPYHVRYFYDWSRQGAGAGWGGMPDGLPYYDSYCNDEHPCMFSFWHVDIEKTGSKAGKAIWQATFKVVRTDGEEFDTFSITREKAEAK